AAGHQVVRLALIRSPDRERARAARLDRPFEARGAQGVLTADQPLPVADGARARSARPPVVHRPLRRPVGWLRADVAQVELPEEGVRLAVPPLAVGVHDELDLEIAVLEAGDRGVRYQFVLSAGQPVGVPVGTWPIAVVGPAEEAEMAHLPAAQLGVPVVRA